MNAMKPLLLTLLLSGCGFNKEETSSTPATPAPAPTTAKTVIQEDYMAVSDGVRLRYHLEYLEGAEKGPVLLQYDGYSAGTGPDFGSLPDLKARLLPKGYRFLGVSIRGTGCSGGGNFDLFSPQWAKDGAEVVEWAAAQPWSNGDIGMLGYSYPGIMQLFTAAEQPPHLKAIAPANVLTDLYADVGAPGGILNTTFSSLFTVQQEAPSLTAVPTAVLAGDSECAANHAINLASYRSFVVEGLLNGSYRDDAFDYDKRSVSRNLSKITVPMLNVLYWQDEQTGSRMGGFIQPGGFFDKTKLGNVWTLWSNGNHDFTYHNKTYTDLAEKFFDHYLRGEKNGWERTPHIQILHEVRVDDEKPNWITTYNELPKPEASTFYLGANGAMTREKVQDSASTNYLYPSLSPGTNPFPGGLPIPTLLPSLIPAEILDALWQVPASPLHQAVFTTEPFTQDEQYLGSGSADLWLSSTSNEIDIQVTLSEIRADGKEVYIQRGWQRASKRTLDEKLTTATHPVPTFLRKDGVALSPGEVVEVRAEVLPFAHRIRKGSALRLIIDTPSPVTGDWGFLISFVPSVNTIYHAKDRPSKLVLGRVAAPPNVPPAPACGNLMSQPCR